jgi:hypothetical protein
MVGRACRRQSFTDAEIAKQVIERSVLEHENDKVFKEQFRHELPLV